jgi:L-ribulokinase
MEATAFGTRVIIENYRAHGVPVGECVVAGGLAKNSLLMQIYADVTRLALSVLDSEQGPALGAAIHAAVAAGAHPDVPSAARAMGRVRRDVYRPDEARARAYDELFALYLELHDHFGRHPRLMRSLAAIRRAARSGAGGDGA